MNKYLKRLVLAAVAVVLVQPGIVVAEYFIVQPVNVTVGGQSVTFKSGQAVTVLGINGGNAMVRVALPDGSAGIAQIPAADLVQRSSAAVAPTPAALAPTPQAAQSRPLATPASPAGISTPAPLPTFPPLGHSSMDAPSADNITLSPDETLKPATGFTTYTETKSRGDKNEFAVYIPAAFKSGTPIPLLVDAHGNGGNGPAEIHQWQKLADEIGFIVVCPTFLSSVTAADDNLKSDEKMVTNIMRRVLGSFTIDRKHVLFTGFSGGGFSTWCIATKHADIFTALCLRSGNFPGPDCYNLKGSIGKWRHRPVYIYLAAQDNPNINAQGPPALAFAKRSIDEKSLKYELLPLTGHSSRPEYTAKWFQSLIQAPIALDSPM